MFGTDLILSGGLARRILVPGSDNILVFTRGVTLGRGSALVSAASVGLFCHSVFAAAGASGAPGALRGGLFSVVE